jgi:hypothetical protein
MCTALAVPLFSSGGVSQTVGKQDAAKERTMFATNRCFSKGGLGIVNTSLYIVVKSAKNELLLGEKKSWSGLDASNPEVVVFFDGKVWVPPSLPKAFDLSKGVVVSFESDKIRFFDFQAMSGGYYERISQ